MFKEGLQSQSKDNRMVFISVDTLSALIKQSYKEELSKIIKSENTTNKKFYTLDEAAEYLCLSKSTLRKFIKLGKLKKEGLPASVVRFSIDELNRFSNSYR